MKRRLHGLFFFRCSSNTCYLPLVIRMSTAPVNESTLNPPSAPENSMESNNLETTRSDASLVSVTVLNERTDDSTAAKNKEGQQSSTRRQRGNQGVFQGEYKDYLQLRVPEYLALASRNERTPWLTGFVEDWFTKWPWHLGSEPEEFQVLNSSTALQSLTPDAIKDLKERRKSLHDNVVKGGQEVGFLSLRRSIIANGIFSSFALGFIASLLIRRKLEAMTLTRLSINNYGKRRRVHHGLCQTSNSGCRMHLIRTSFRRRTRRRRNATVQRKRIG